ncbi:MAG: HAD family hydrolase [Erysipelotrichales bacterium]|nr:HAD family hydrolase [Erysipelotrichales bacterium]
MEKLCFFFDIDGTLCDGENNYMPQSTQVAVNKLQELGHICAIATGRSYLGCKSVAEKLAIQYCVCDGGNSVYVGDECVSITGIDVELCKALEAYCKEHGLVCVKIDNEHYYYDHRVAEMEATHPWITYNGTTPKEDAVIMKIGILASVEEEKKIQDTFDFNFTTFKGTRFMVTDQDNKHVGIERCIKLMGYTGKHIVFGDSMNDIKMFANADYSVCMGQAKEEVKQKADYVTSSLEEDGIYRACEALGYFEVEYEEGKDQ